MFCYKCGYQIPDDAQFCFKCGVAQTLNNSKVNINDNVGTSRDLDREALIIYLFDTLTMEFLKFKLKSKLEKLDSEITFAQNNNYYQRYNLINNEYVWLWYNGGEYFICFENNRGSQQICITPELPSNIAWYPIKDNWDYLNNNSNWTIWRSSIPSAVKYQFFKVGKRKERFINVLKQFKIDAPPLYKKFEEKFYPTICKRNVIKSELETVSKILRNLYNVNIIPQQFRNLHTVYFLYDFIKTSNETLSTALLHYDLDKIKEKLDTVIDQQKEIIINQAIIIAQNAQMIEQNQQTLNRLASIEQNTDRAAQYAKIAANNAEACAWIGIANYIKN